MASKAQERKRVRMGTVELAGWTLLGQRRNRQNPKEQELWPRISKGPGFFPERRATQSKEGHLDIVGLQGS